jgi:hypothetical protein
MTAYSVTLSGIDYQTSLFFTNASKGQLQLGGCIYSPQQAFRLRFQQSDNNLIIDAIDDSKIPSSLAPNTSLPASSFNWLPIWSIYTNEGIKGITGAATFFVQQDGNVVLYDGAHNWKYQTNTEPNAAVVLTMQDNGDLVLYNAQNKALWHTNTYAGPADRPHAGKV